MKNELSAKEMNGQAMAKMSLTFIIAALKAEILRKPKWRFFFETPCRISRIENISKNTNILSKQISKYSKLYEASICYLRPLGISILSCYVNEPRHYATQSASHYASHYAGHYASHYASHYAGHYESHYASHYAGHYESLYACYDLSHYASYSAIHCASYYASHGENHYAAHYVSMPMDIQVNRQVSM